MAPAPATAPAPKTPSTPSPPTRSAQPPSSSKLPPPSGSKLPPPSGSKPPPPSGSKPLPPAPTKPPPAPSRSKPPSPPNNSRGATPPSASSPPPSRTGGTPVNDPQTDGGASSKTPPAPASKFPARPTHKSPSKTSTSSDSTSQYTASSAALIGGIAAIGFVFLALIIVCVLCNRKKKKPYYMDPSFEQPPGVGGGGPYYNGKLDHVVKFGNVGGGGGGGWQQPPPPTNSSSEFSGSRLLASPNMPLAFSKSQFSYNELAVATGGFIQSNLLGQGGFGYVHKGVLPNGQEVAVKSLKAGSGQGEREFQAEVEIISRVHHRHLVSLVGYCISDVQRMLVYEFVPNKTLEFHLHGKGHVVMDWQTRMRIALGSAKGLAYLHEDCHPRIIHRDIKSANILLDHNHEAMVADFGLAKLSSGNDTHVSTRVMGTFGYLAPEYASSGKLTEKSDVFSFGVMLLEILTGRKPVDPLNDYMEDSLVDWARPLIGKAMEDGEYGELVDPRLEGDYDRNEMARMASCVSVAVRHSAKRRPKMSQIVRALEGDASLDSLDAKTKRGGSTLNSNEGYETRVYDTRAYNNDMMKFKQMVMSSQEFPSGEYSGPSTSSNELANFEPYRQTM